MITINDNLKGKVIAVTGAGGILCGSMARELVRQGAHVALLDLNLDSAEKIAEELRNDGGVAYAFACNVLDKASVETAKSAINEKLGKVEILLNGAGGNHPKGQTANEYSGVKLDGNSFFDLDVDGFSFVFNLNFIGTFIPSQVFMSDLVETKGSVLNVSSMSSFSSLTKVAAYSAAKAAVNNFTQWMAVHFADSGVRVNAIAPGFFVTTQNKDLLVNADGSYTDRSHKIIEATPMRKFGTPEDLLGTVIWLCDEAMSGFVTGIVVPIDGGYSSYTGV